MKFIGLFNLIVFGVMLYVSGSYITYTHNQAREFEEKRLQIEVNTCVDAAAFMMLETDDLGKDYQDFGSVKTRPELALDTFLNMMCIAYDMSMSEDNKEMIAMKYLPVFMVATYDGFYVANPALVSTGGYDDDLEYIDDDGEHRRGGFADPKCKMQFSPKFPYKYVNGTDVYALNLGTNTALRVDTGNYKIYKTSNFPSEISTKERRIAYINQTITDTMSASIEKVNGGEIGVSTEFYLPKALTTYTDVSPITGPTVICLLQNVDLKSVEKVSAFGVGGARINNTRMVMGYEDGGVKYYAYSDLVPKNSDGSPMYVATGMYRTPKEAAEHGYKCDLRYLE